VSWFVGEFSGYHIEPVKDFG